MKRIRQEDVKKLHLQGKVKHTSKKKKPAKPPRRTEPKPAPDHSAILSKVAAVLQSNADENRNVLESVKALMEREPTSAVALRQLTEALQGIHPPAPVQPWGKLRFEIERDGNNNMRAVHVTRDGAPTRLN